MEDESKLKSQQIEASNESISHLSREIEALSNSLQEKKATVAQLWSQLQTCQKVPEQLLDSLPQTIQIVQRLEHKLQEAEYQKQQAELEREATVQEVKVLWNFELQLHAELGKLYVYAKHLTANFTFRQIWKFFVLSGIKLAKADGKMLPKIRI